MEFEALFLGLEPLTANASAPIPIAKAVKGSNPRNNASNSIFIYAQFNWFDLNITD